MATQTLSSSNGLLRRALQADGLFGIAGGLLCTFGANPIASFMGLANSLPILVIGLGLLAWGVGLLALAARPVIDRRLTTFIILANVVWVIGSAIILAADLFGLTTGGRWAVLVVADVVLLFALAEFAGLRREG
jgi:uncharacterized membrane protein YhaH (DUF805 family)